MSSLLVSTYDLRRGGIWLFRKERKTVISIVNPTLSYKRVFVLFFDDNENLLTGIQNKLSPNDLWEVKVAEHVKPGYHVVLKVAVFHDRMNAPEVGVIGYQLQFHGKETSHSILQPLPTEILDKEQKLFWKYLE